MKKTKAIISSCAALVASGALILSLASADEQAQENTADPASPETAADTKEEGEDAARPEPKPLSDNIHKALAYLAEEQSENGGWGQGGGWRTQTGGRSGRVEGAGVEDPPDIGNTSIALLAFMRAGESFDAGNYSGVMTKAAQFLLAEVDKDKGNTLFVTSVRDTQLQTKIGRYVDTFLAALVLSEMKGKLPSDSMETARADLLAQVIAKIEKHQKADGRLRQQWRLGSGAVTRDCQQVIDPGLGCWGRRL